LTAIPGRRTVKLRYFASSCAKVATENSTSGSGSVRAEGVKMYGNKEQERLANSAARVQAEVVVCEA